MFYFHTLNDIQDLNLSNSKIDSRTFSHSVHTHTYMRKQFYYAKINHVNINTNTNDKILRTIGREIFACNLTSTGEIKNLRNFAS